MAAGAQAPDLTRCGAGRKSPLPIRTSTPRVGRLPCHALDFIKRRGVFQRGGIAEFFAEISGSNDAPHDFGVSRFWYVADENHLARRERFAEMGGERAF